MRNIAKPFSFTANMNPTLQYYLGHLATRDDLSNQAKALRNILFIDDEALFLAVKQFIAQQKELTTAR